MADTFLKSLSGELVDLEPVQLAELAEIASDFAKEAVYQAAGEDGPPDLEQLKELYRAPCPLLVWRVLPIGGGPSLGYAGIHHKYAITSVFYVFHEGPLRPESAADAIRLLAPYAYEEVNPEEQGLSLYVPVSDAEAMAPLLGDLGFDQLDAEVPDFDYDRFVPFVMWPSSYEAYYKEP